MQNFEVSSYIKKYSVSFTDVFSLNNVLDEGDVVIIDKKIKGLYPTLFSNVEINFQYIEVEATEDNKSYLGLVPVIEKLLTLGFHKNNKLVAVGGGIVQDITAFISSILYRGVKWQLIPTTLLAQCDSCIGSKTSINFDIFKNQIGGFYPPEKIYIDTNFIKTLDNKEIKSGLGEMLHYYVIAGKEEFEFYKKNYIDAISNRSIMEQLIYKSLLIKKQYIEIDEFDRKERQIFNYGHSFGHAIEAMTGYYVPHGIAVSIGMDIANFISVKMGYMSETDRNEIREVTKFFTNDYQSINFSLDRYLSLLSKDKKNAGKKLGLILCRTFGDLYKEMVVPDSGFREWIIEYFEKEFI